MTQKPVLACTLALTALMALSVAAAQNTPQAASKATAPVSQKQPALNSATQTHSEGDRVFAQNCARCHTSPDGFSPHISGTIVLHMRVRASLSRHDEEELLRFFNP